VATINLGIATNYMHADCKAETATSMVNPEAAITKINQFDFTR